MRYKYYVGVDIGKTGALSVLSPEGGIVEIIDIPMRRNKLGALELNYKALRGVLKPYVAEAYICVEAITPYKVGPLAIDWQDELARDRYLALYGMYRHIVGVVDCLAKSYACISAHTWRIFQGLTGSDYHANKAASLALAGQIWPEYHFERDDQAEASLIALYGLRQQITGPVALGGCK